MSTVQGSEHVSYWWISSAVESMLTALVYQGETPALRDVLYS